MEELGLLPKEARLAIALEVFSSAMTASDLRLAREIEPEVMPGIDADVDDVILSEVDKVV
jgi:hypothetical protein